MPRSIRRSVLAVLAATLGCMHSSGVAQIPTAESKQPASPPPKLIVFITVDQLRGDMLARYQNDLHGGYARLMGGAWFTNAFQDHAITETAPGHASTMSGRFPRSTGITSNSVGVVDRNFPLLVGKTNETGASPARFQGTTLFDWIHAADSRARALSVSTKDRAAILPIGKAKQDVYWYSTNGSFTTSTYYRDALPAWVTAFNKRRIGQSYASAFWTLSRPFKSYSEPDSVKWENRGHSYVFPHPLPDDTANVTDVLRATPTIDSLLALFALEGLQQTGIGRGPQTDILAVSFSATDFIGHAYGPDSREAHENEIRLDQTLGWFLDSLYRLRDSSTVMIALTGDHGMSPIPELAREEGWATGNQGLRVSLMDEAFNVLVQLASAGVDTSAWRYDGEMATLDRSAFTRSSLKADAVLDAFVRAVRKVPGVARVDRMAELRKADPDRDPIARRWTHQIPDDSPVDLVITLTRYSIWSATLPATHGSPYDQDASVPIIFYGPWVKPGKYAAFTRTVDMGPTLAAIAGVKPLEKLDGVILSSVFR